LKRPQENVKLNKYLVKEITFLVYVLPFHVAHHYVNTSQMLLTCLKAGCWGKQQHHKSKNKELQPEGGKWFSQFHI